MKISISASLDSQVPFANEPPNSNPITSGYFSISFSTKLYANFLQFAFLIFLLFLMELQF